MTTTLKCSDISATKIHVFYENFFDFSKLKNDKYEHKTPKTPNFSYEILSKW